MAEMRLKEVDKAEILLILDNTRAEAPFSGWP